MNMNVLAFMVAITVFAVGTVTYALAYRHSLLLAALAGIGGLALAPWHKWLK
jgi:hypothetical protein